MGRILLREPFDLVDLLLYLQTLEIVELGLVALEGAIDIVLTLAMRRIFALWFPLEDDNPAALVACGQQLPRVVELDSRDDIGFGHIAVVPQEAVVNFPRVRVLAH